MKSADSKSTVRLFLGSRHGYRPTKMQVSWEREADPASLDARLWNRVLSGLYRSSPDPEIRQKAAF